MIGKVKVKQEEHMNGNDQKTEKKTITRIERSRHDDQSLDDIHWKSSKHCWPAILTIRNAASPPRIAQRP